MNNSIPNSTRCICFYPNSTRGICFHPNSTIEITV